MSFERGSSGAVRKWWVETGSKMVSAHILMEAFPFRRWPVYRVLLKQRLRWKRDERPVQTETSLLYSLSPHASRPSHSNKE